MPAFGANVPVRAAFVLGDGWLDAFYDGCVTGIKIVDRNGVVHEDTMTHYVFAPVQDPRRKVPVRIRIRPDGTRSATSQPVLDALTTACGGAEPAVGSTVKLRFGWDPENTNMLRILLGMPGENRPAVSRSATGGV